MNEPVPLPPVRGIEVKVSVASLLSLVASVSIALLNAVVADSSILGGLPAWLQFVIIMSAPPLLAFLGGYVMPSTTSAVSEGYQERRAA